MSSRRYPFYFIALALVLVITGLLWGYVLTEDNLSDIAVEFHGMLFDVILFGILLTFYDSYLDNKKKKEDLLEQIKAFEREIDDFREWHEPESKYRIFGIIKRIRKLNEKEKLGLEINHDLHDCYLPEINLREKDFSKTNFKNAILTGANLDFGVFVKTDFSKANLDKATLFNATLKNAILCTTSFKSAIICADFTNSILGKTDFSKSIFWKADFRGVDLDEVILKGVRYDSTSKFSKEYTEENLKERGMIHRKSVINKIVNDKRILNNQFFRGKFQAANEND